jgi:hypothetical protein
MKKPRIDAFDTTKAPQLGSPLDNLPAIVPPARKSDGEARYEGAHGQGAVQVGSVMPGETSETARKATSNDTVIPRYQDTMVSHDQDEVVEVVRKAVKHLGKEAATYRFTEDEKKALSNVMFTYKNKKVRTSENEITRIAINLMLEDYRRHGELSLLAKVLERLKE